MRAYAHDLKAFFTIVGKEPVEVRPADVVGFVTAQRPPRLTCEMVARLQGWEDDWGWRFSGRKIARCRHIGNAFPPPVAEAVGSAIRWALSHEGAAEAAVDVSAHGGGFVVAAL